MMDGPILGHRLFNPLPLRRIFWCNTFQCRHSRPSFVIYFAQMSQERRKLLGPSSHWIDIKWNRIWPLTLWAFSYVGNRHKMLDQATKLRHGQWLLPCIIFLSSLTHYAQNKPRVVCKFYLASTFVEQKNLSFPPREENLLEVIVRKEGLMAGRSWAWAESG